MNAPFPPPRPEDQALLGPLSARRVVKKAVILAAGRGRRMGKLTKDRPKAALVVGDHALIDWQIAALQAAGVAEIAVVTGHGAQALAGRGVTYIHNPDWAQGTQVDSLLRAQAWIGEEPVIVSYGDILYHPSAVLALLERPGDIVIAYDADHRWLWKRRFGNWLKDSETFKLGPGQVLTEIGGKPTDIEELDGQFMGLMLFTPAGRVNLARNAAALGRPDFTTLLAGLLARGNRIDTAVNILPWMEIDTRKDLTIALGMTTPSRKTGRRDLQFARGTDLPKVTLARNQVCAERTQASPVAKVQNAFAVQNWGRSGSTFLQSLLDDHPQVLSTPNFYSRSYFVDWAWQISQAPDEDKPQAFLEAFQQWWDTGLVDAAAGLHRLGAAHDETAGVELERLRTHLRAFAADGRKLTRKAMFEAAHLAYAHARGQALASEGLQILFPIHGEARGVACAFLEDFPNARFIHTLREPVSNTIAVIDHIRANALDDRVDPVVDALGALFGRAGARYGRMCTAFGDRPYLRHLADRDQVLLLKLEDLHRHGQARVREVARWLGLNDDPRLSVSTFDGKTWWNRAESGTTSVLGRPREALGPRRPVSLTDRRRIWEMARATPLVLAAYKDAAPPPAAGLPAPARFITPSRLDPEPSCSELRCVEALLSIGVLLPAPLKQALTESSRRLHRRTQLIAMAAGAKAVRRALPPSRRHEPVNALILLSLTPEGWRKRALAMPAAPGDMGPDVVSVLFMDEIAREPSISHLAYQTFILLLGRPLSRLSSYARLRRLMIHAATIRKRDLAL